MITDGSTTIGLTEKIAYGAAAIAASFYLVERAIRFNVDLTDRYKAEIERLETKIVELEKREEQHLALITNLERRETGHVAKITVLEDQLAHLERTVETMRIAPPAKLPDPPKPPVPPTRRTTPRKRRE